MSEYRIERLQNGLWSVYHRASGLYALFTRDGTPRGASYSGHKEAIRAHLAS